MYLSVAYVYVYILCIPSSKKGAAKQNRINAITEYDGNNKD